MPMPATIFKSKPEYNPDDWYITDEDIEHVLNKYSVWYDLDAARTYLDLESIVDNLMFYDEKSDQIDSLYFDLETQLLQSEIIKLEKGESRKFNLPS